MIVEILEEDESRVKWSHDNGKTWKYADIDELINCWEEKQWIPVSERLPEKGKDLLVYDGECVYVAYYYDGKWWSSDYHLSGDRPVKAWMPLPEPYREEQEHE